MNSYTSLPAALANSERAPELLQLADALPEILARYFNNDAHGDYARWQSALDALPGVNPSAVDLANGRIQIGHHDDLSADQHQALESALREFHPWRKGPFELFGTHIDTEWRCDWKWQRLEDAISPLHGKRVLDVGSSNGYYSLRMAGNGAEMVLGIDPTLVYVMQYRALMRYLADAPVWVLPLRLWNICRLLHMPLIRFSRWAFYTTCVTRLATWTKCASVCNAAVSWCWKRW